MSGNEFEKLIIYSNKHNINIKKKNIENQIYKKISFYQNILEKNLINYYSYKNYYVDNYLKNRNELLELLDLIKDGIPYENNISEMKYIAIYSN